MTDRHTTPLSGRTILVAEDAMAIAQDVEEALLDCGCTVVGPFPRLDRLIAAIEADGFRADAAVLDVDLRGEEVFPAIELLTARSIPVLLTTGFADLHIPAAHRDLPRLEKPVSLEEMLARVAGLITPGAAGSSPA